MRPVAVVVAVVVLVASVARPARAASGRLFFSVSGCPVAVVPSLVDALQRIDRHARDISVEFDALRGLSALRTGNLDAAPPPEFFPPPLAAVWKQAVDACKARSGGPPYGIGNRAAVLCGTEAADGIWQRWLDDEAPSRVVELTCHGSSDLDAVAYAPREPTGRRGSVALSVDEAQRLVRRLLDGGGTTVARSVIDRVPEAPPGTRIPSDERSYGFEAVPLGDASRCPRLVLDPATDALAKTVLGRWAKSVGTRTTGERRCTFRYDAGASVSATFGTSIPLAMFRAEVDCEGVRVRAKALGLAQYEENMQRKLSRELVTELAQKLCR